MAKAIKNYDWDKVFAILGQISLEDKKAHAVPVVNPQSGLFTGEYYDDRQGAPPGQPNPERVKTQVEYLSEKYGNKFMFAAGMPGPVEETQPGILDTILPDIVKAAYNESLTGTAQQIITKREPYDLKDWDPNTFEKVGSQILSFFMPLDLAVMVAGGGVGGAAVKGILTKAVSKAVAKKVLSGMGKAAAKRAVGRSLVRLGSSAGGLGAYEGAREHLRQTVDKEDLDILKIVKETAKGAGLGGIMGLAGGMMKTRPFAKGLESTPLKGKIAKEAVEAGAGIGTLGGVAPLLSGEMPSFESLRDAATFVVGFRAAHGTAKYAVKKINFWRDVKNTEKEIKTWAEEKYPELKEDNIPINEIKPESQKISKNEAYRAAVQDMLKEQSEDFYVRKVPAKTKKGNPIYEMVVPPEGTEFKSQLRHFQKAFRIAERDKTKLYLPKEMKEGNPLFDALKKQGYTSERANKKGGYYAKEPDVLKDKTTISAFERAYELGKIDENMLKMAKLIVRRNPEINTKDVWKITNTAKKLTDDVRVKGQATQITQRDNARTLIELFEGADAETIVHEHYHGYWNRLTPPQKKVFEEYHKLSGDKRPLKEHFAEEGSSAYFSGKWHGLKKVGDLFTDARISFNDLVKGVRDVRELKPPKEIMQIYRQGMVRDNLAKKYAGRIKGTYKKTKPPESKEEYLASKSAEESARVREAEVDYQVDRKSRLTNITVNKELGNESRAKEIIKNISQPIFLRQTKNRLNSKPAQEYKQGHIEADNTWHAMWGNGLENLMKAGLKSKWKDGNALSKALGANHPDAKNIAKVLLAIRNEAAKYRDIGLIKDGYFPRVLNDKIRDLLINDIQTLERELKNIEKPTDATLASILVHKSKPLREAVQNLLSKNMAKSTAQAISMINREIRAMANATSSFSRRRSFEFPASFYETNAHKVLPYYIESMTKMIAHDKVWGPDGGKLLKLLNRIGEVDYNEMKLANKLAMMWTGEYELKYGLTGKSRAIADIYTTLEFALKIGLGRATVLNLAQPTISIIPDMGIWNTIKGGLRLFDPGVREKVRRTGAITPYVMQAITGDVPGSASSKWAQLSKMMGKVSGFESVNKGLQYLAASTAEVAIKGWQNTARGSGPRAKWARARLADFGLKHNEPINESKMAHAMYRFATDSQLQKNLLNDPLIANDPKYRPFMLFKRFGIRQATYIKDMVLREARRGNMMPIIRLAAAGYAGGEMVHWAINTLQTQLSGEPTYRKDKDWSLERAANNIAIIGAFGMVSDIFEIDQISRIPERLKFLVSPVIVTDINNYFDAWTKFMQDWERYESPWLAGHKNTYSVFGFMGSLPRYLGKRTMTDPQKENRIKYFKTKEREEIIKLLLGGHSEDAKRRYDLWNQKHDMDHQISFTDVSPRAVLKWLKNKMNTKLRALGQEKDSAVKREEIKKLRVKAKKAARLER